MKSSACHFRSFYVVPPTTHHTRHHELFEGVIYHKSPRKLHFYIRPKDPADHRDVLVMRDPVRSRRHENGERVTPANVESLTHALMEAHYIL